MNQTFGLSEVIEAIGMPHQIGFDAQRRFSNAAALQDAGIDSLVWISPHRAEKQALLLGTPAAIVICDSSALPDAGPPRDKTTVIVDSPRLAFLRVVARYLQTRPESGIHPTAFVHPLAVIGQRVHIGPFSYIGHSQIGDDSVIHGHVHLYDQVKIGQRVVIHAGTVIGSDGFGYQRNQEGMLEKFPHIGGVIIEDDVEIGANTAIDRGTLGHTIIRRRARVDNLIHVAHNVEIGEDAAVIALTMIGGSTRIGRGAWIAPAATLRDGISIDDGATVGLGAVVTKSVPAGEVWAGVPARKWSEK